MATDDQPAEQVTELLQNLKVDSQTNAGDTPEGTPNLEGDALHSGTEASAPSGFPDVVAGAYEGYFDTGVYYTANYYTVPHGYYYGGYEYPIGDWEDYSQHIGIDSSEVQTLANDIYGVYDENGTLLYHAGGYGYTQPIYGPYTSGAPILANSQLYSPSYPYPAHIYQQPMASSAQLTSSVSSDVPINTIESANQGISGMNGALVNGNNAPLGQRAHYPATILPSVGPYRPTMLPSTGSLPVSQDGNSGTTWKNGSKVADGREGHAMSEPLSVTGPPGQTLYSGTQTATRMPAGQPRFPSTAAPLLGAYSRFYHSPARAYSGFIPGRGQGLRFNGVDSRGNGSAWTFDKGRARGRAPGPICNGNENLDVLNEQNRGPRTSRIRNQQTLPGASRLLCQEGGVNGNSYGLGALVSREQYNRSDFSTNYENAKFFIIKSYSEDDIHKSIKYNVWASTPNGNKKLDAAYKEAQEKAGHCPVFLFFSVNASGQFCGVAEMVGAVDFSKNMDFWQQDKWNGRFPVKWHIIKDVPNNQFRHIILANNDNKPVTNSRDTQEVNFQQGIEMLNLFKNYIFKTSILDDFQFYENRQRAMQEKRTRQQLHTQPQLMMPPGCLDNTDLHNGTPSNLADENRQSEGDGNTSQLGSTSTVTLSGTSPMESSSLLRTVEKESLARAGVQSENGNSSNGSKNSDE